MQQRWASALSSGGPLPSPEKTRFLPAGTQVVGVSLPEQPRPQEASFCFSTAAAAWGLSVLLCSLSSRWPNHEETFGVHHGTIRSFLWGFPDGSDGKESACSVEDPSSIPGWGRSPGGGNGHPLHYSGLENPVDREEPGGLWSMESKKVGHS